MEARWKRVRSHNIIAGTPIPNIIQGVNVLCHTVNMGDIGAPGRGTQRENLSKILVLQFSTFLDCFCKLTQADLFRDLADNLGGRKCLETESYRRIFELLIALRKC